MSELSQLSTASSGASMSETSITIPHSSQTTIPTTIPATILTTVPTTIGTDMPIEDEIIPTIHQSDTEENLIIPEDLIDHLEDNLLMPIDLKGPPDHRKIQRL